MKPRVRWNVFTTEEAKAMIREEARAQGMKIGEFVELACRTARWLRLTADKKGGVEVEAR